MASIFDFLRTLITAKFDTEGVLVVAVAALGLYCWHQYLRRKLLEQQIDLEAKRRESAADERAASIVQCRFFGGLSLEETAEALGVSSKTVLRSWIASRAWLRKEIGRDLSP